MEYIWTNWYVVIFQAKHTSFMTFQNDKVAYFSICEILEHSNLVMIDAEIKN